MGVRPFSRNYVEASSDAPPKDNLGGTFLETEVEPPTEKGEALLAEAGRQAEGASGGES